jgi:hypothetical protein
MGKSPKEEMAVMPVWPLRADFQKAGTPIPMGDTIPSPVMTTRDAIYLSESKVLTYQNFEQIGRG